MARVNAFRRRTARNLPSLNISSDDDGNAHKRSSSTGTQRAIFGQGSFGSDRPNGIVSNVSDRFGGSLSLGRGNDSPWVSDSQVHEFAGDASPLSECGTRSPPLRRAPPETQRSNTSSKYGSSGSSGSRSPPLSVNLRGRRLHQTLITDENVEIQTPTTSSCLVLEPTRRNFRTSAELDAEFAAVLSTPETSGFSVDEGDSHKHPLSWFPSLDEEKDESLSSCYDVDDASYGNASFMKVVSAIRSADDGKHDDQAVPFSDGFRGRQSRVLAKIRALQALDMNKMGAVEE